MSKKRYKAGVIGCGFGETHVRLLKESDRVDVEWIAYHTNRNRALAIAGKYGIPVAMPDSEVPLRDIDFVVIVTPVVHHFAIAKAAILQGKSVVCDKPLAMNSEEASELVELAEKNNVANMVFFQMRFLPLFQKVKGIIDSQALGKIHTAQIDFFHDFILENPESTWRQDAAASGSGAFGDMGVHLIDCIHWLVEDRMEVLFVNKRATHLRKTNTEDYGTASFRLNRLDIEGTLNICRTAKGYHLIRLILLGENGTVALNWNPTTNVGEVLTFGCQCPQMAIPFHSNPYHSWLDHFEKKDTPIPTFKDGKIAQSTLDQIIAYERKKDIHRMSDYQISRL